MANIWDELEKQAFEPNKKEAKPSGTSVWDTLEAKAFGNEPQKSVSSNRFSAAIDQYQAGLLGAGEAVTGALGITGAEEALRERRIQNEQAAERSLAQAREQGAVESYKDVKDLSSAGSYVAGLAIQSAPYAAEALVGGLGARALMGGTRAALSAAVTGGDVIGEAAARQTLSRGSQAGAAAASYPSAVGDVLQNQRDQTGTTDLKSAAGLAIPYAALNVLGVEGTLAKGQLFRSAGSLLDDVSGVKGGLTRAGITGVKTGAGESLSETAQEGLNQFGRMAVDPNETFLNEKSKERFMESAVGGFVLGGAAGSIGGGWRRSEGSILPGSTDSGNLDVSNKPDNNAINKAIDGNSPELEAERIVPNGLEKWSDQNLKATLDFQMSKGRNANVELIQMIDAEIARRGGTEAVDSQAVVRNQQLQAAQNQVQAQEQAKQEQIAQVKAARESTFKKYGGQVTTLPGGTKPVFNFLGKQYFTLEDMNKAVDAVVAKELVKPPMVRQVEDALASVVPVVGGKPYTPAKMASFLSPYVNQAESIEEVAARIDARLANIKPNSPESDTLTALRNVLRGEPAEGNINQTQGVENGQLQLQDNAGLRKVSEQGGTTQTGGTGAGNVRSTSVQPVGTTSLGEGSLSLQTGNLPSGGISTSTATTPSGAANPNANQTQGQVNEAGPTVTVKKRRSVVSGQAAEGNKYGEQTPEETAADIVESVIKSVIDAVVKRRGRMTNVNLEKLKEFIYYDFVQVEDRKAGKPGLSKKELSEMFGVSPDTIDGWQGIANNFFEENRGVIQAKLYETIDARGISLVQLREDVQAKRDNALNDAIILEEGQQKEVSTKDDEQAAKGEIKETAAADQALTEVEDESQLDQREAKEEGSGVAIHTGRKGISLQEEHKPEETVNAKMEKLLKQYDEAVNSGDEELENQLIAEIDKLTQEARRINDKKVAKSEAIAPKKETPNANEKPSPKSETVGDKSKTSKRVRKQNTERGKAAAKSKQADEKSEPLTVEETPKAVTYQALALYVIQSDLAKGITPLEPSDWAMGRTKPEGLDQQDWFIQTVSQSSQLAAAFLKNVPARQLQEAKEVVAWNVLKAPVSYNQLSPQAKADWALSVKDGKYNLAAASKIYEDNQKSIAKQLADESRTIDGTDLITEVGEQEQYLMLTNQMGKLTEAQVSRLEKHYGEERDTPYFMQSLKEDVLKYVEKGAEAVAGVIRDIIRQMANGVMAMAVVFNPSFTSQPIKFAVPTYETRTTEVIAQVPSDVAQAMSPAAKRAYEVIYPTIKDQLIKNDKLFVVTDKPTATNFIFSPDGTLLFQSKVLIGKTEGNYYKGNNDIVANRITAAGLYNMGMREGGKTAGEYDFNKVFGIEQIENGEKYFVTMMHSVWTKESDAEQRLAALKETGPQNSRYSFGCINVDKETFGKILAGHEKQMDGAKLFIVPDGNENVMEFINGKAVYSSDMVREKAEPLTKTEKVPKQGTGTTERTLAAKEEKIEGKEEKVQFSKTGKAKNPEKAANIDQELKAFIGNINIARLQVVQNIDNLPKDVQDIVRDKQQKSGDVVQALVKGNKVYMIASNIEKGTARAVFMHEVGSHLGLEKLLSTENYNKLADTLASWVKKNDGSIESELAIRALIRSLESGETGPARTKEFVAYFIEEAVNAGIDPTAMKHNSSLARWFTLLWATFKRAIRKLGLNPEKMTAQDVVDMAYGAARLEVHGSWHGTAADFRKFNHDYMGTGEGNQAFGWGTYMAQRQGIAYDYWGTDTRNKAVEPQFEYKGRNFRNDILQIDEQSDLLNALRTIENVIRNNPTVDSRIALRQAQVNAKNQVFMDQGVLKRALEERNQLKNEANNEMLQEHLIEQNKNKIARIKKSLKKDEAILKELESLKVEDIKITRQGSPLGNLMRVDHNVEANELLDLDIKLSEQPDIYEMLRNGFPLDMELQLQKEIKKPLLQATGEDIYFGLKSIEESRKGLSKALEQRPLRSSGETVSMFLDSIGIKGNIYLDRPSRNENAPTTLQTRNTVIFNDANVFRIASHVGAEREDIKFSIKKAREEAINQIDKLPTPLKGPLGTIFTAVTEFAKNALPYLAFTEDLARVAEKYIPSAKRYVELINNRGALKRTLERRVTKVLEQFSKLDKSLKGIGKGSINEFLYDSTISDKWAYNPGWIQNFKNDMIDPALKARFEAMPTEAQEVIKAVFAHGNETLLEMQEAVSTSVASDYDALIAAAKKNGSLKEERDLVNKKNATLKEFQGMMKINRNKPYSPLKRFGEYVVVGRSKEYLALENIVDDPNSTPDQVGMARAKMRGLQTDENHYFVQFAENKFEARSIEKQEERNFAGGLVQHFKKDEAARQTFYGGQDLEGVFYRLRNMVEESLDDADVKSSEKAIKGLLVDLHYAMLSEQSARQSERKRRKIAGAEKDMMRSFSSQGQATANFIASVKNSSEMYDVLQKMKREADAKTPGRDERRRYYNEFLKRHVMGMEYHPSQFIDKALATTSVWTLLTNPSYYLQNALQPWMLSLPMIGAKYGYTKSADAMFKAYNELSGIIREHGVGEDTYAKMPKDVQDVIEELVNRGRIDIGLEADMGNWRSTNGENEKLTIAMNALRNVAQDIETINRIATAVAAYRLAIKDSSKEQAIAYADKVIYDTHGDYTGANAPRFMRSSAGRIATQFRKFQLIQLSLMAKLFHDAFKGTGKTAEETADIRRIGKKALMYTLGHTAVAGGLMGMPGFVAISALYGALFGDDDEPWDAENKLRKAIDNEFIADLLLKGAPMGFLGIDTSGKLGMGTMLSILPYTDIDFSRKGVESAGFALLTGPTGGLVMKTADGLSYIGQGDYYKGIEKMLPTGVSNAMKGFRLATQGLTQRSGDVVLTADEINLFDAAMVAVGLPTEKITKQQYAQGLKADFDTFYNEKTSEIKRTYARAVKEGDRAAIQEARDEWNTIQESRARNGYTRQPYSTLLKAPQELAKKERSVIGGIETTKASRGFVKQISER